jgi:predicted metal-dependent hydrolase
MLYDIPDMLEIGAHQVPLQVRRNRRAKRMYLRYNPADHAFALTLPHRTKMEEGVRFVSSKSDWIVETLRDMPERKKLRAGMTLPILGQMTKIVSVSDLPAPFALKDNRLEIGAGSGTFAKRAEHALKKIARNELTELAECKAQRLGRRINRMTLRDTRSRWGSCSSDANLMFSWRLVFAPYAVLDYVVSHEVAHLRQMNHGPRFWDCVESICPDYVEWKDWLRVHGGELYRFTS